jgi:hypothetical protein
MKKINFIIGFIFFFTMIHIEIFGEEITIDSTISTSCEIFPFGEIGLISSPTLTADIDLHHDTSLVRIIFVPNDDYEYMIFEAYSLIVDSLSFSVREVCDETCFLNELRPYSVKIQIIDAEVTLTSLNYYYEEMENLPQLQFEVKREMDEQKIEKMNSRIVHYDMIWVAGDNNIVAKYYHEKKEMFGEAYHLLGFDYYHEGLFEPFRYVPNPKVDPDLVRTFDWRNRHGANDPSSGYFGDDLGTGWFTSVKDQFMGTCWAFSTASLTEVIANLYANDSLDFDLSEQQLVSCNDTVDYGDCNGGDDDGVLRYIRDIGIVDDGCFPMECPTQICEHMCPSPEYRIKIQDSINVDHKNFDSLRIALINHGPITLDYIHTKDAKGRHAANLAGYLFDSADSTVWWLIKNSWGIGLKPGNCNCSDTAD